MIILSVSSSEHNSSLLPLEVRTEAHPFLCLLCFGNVDTTTYFANGNRSDLKGRPDGERFGFKSMQNGNSW